MTLLLDFLESKVGFAHLHTYFDELRKTLYVFNGKTLIAGMEFKHTDTPHWRVKMAVTAHLGFGLGWWLYFHGIATANKHGATLSADCDCVSGGSVLMWEKLNTHAEITKTPLPLESQCSDYNNEYFEELPTLNPGISKEMWEHYSTLPNDEFDTLFEEGTLLPHLYNMGFSLLNAELLFANIIPRPLSEKEHLQLEYIWDDMYGQQSRN